MNINRLLTSTGWLVSVLAAITPAQTLEQMGTRVNATPITDPAALSLPAPVITPGGGHYKGTVQCSLYSQLPGNIYYTTNGAAPTTSSERITSGSLLTLPKGTTTLRAMAADANGNQSPFAMAQFVSAGLTTAAAPVISLAGGNYASSTIVTLSSTTSGAKIYYTLDGTDPTASSTRYTREFTLTGTNAQTISVRVIAVKAGYINSAIGVANFSIGYSSTVATPTLSPNGGTFSGWTNVTMGCATPNAVIRYTTDGTPPNSLSTLYSGSKYIGISTTLKTQAFVSGMADSAVESTTFTAGSTTPTIVLLSGLIAGSNSANAAINHNILNTAITQAQNVNGGKGPQRTIIRFPTGTYCVGTGCGFVNTNNLTIDGQGSTLIVDSITATPFNSWSCNNLTFMNMRLIPIRSYLPTGFVTNVHIDSNNPANDYFDLLLDPGNDATQTTSGVAFIQFDPVRHCYYDQGLDCFENWMSTALSPNKLRVICPNYGVTVGMYLSLRPAQGHANFGFDKCQGVSLINVESDDATSQGLFANKCEDMTFNHFLTIWRPNSGHVQTHNADGIDINDCKGLITFQDSVFQNQGDDAIDFGAYPVQVKKINGNTITISTGDADMFKAGELISFNKAGSFLAEGSAVIASVSLTTSSTKTLLLSTSPAVSVDDYVTTQTWRPRSIVNRCTFSGNRARGLISMDANGLTVENSRFADIQASGIHIAVPSGGGNQNINILNNSVERCASCAGVPAAIWVGDWNYFAGGNGMVYPTTDQHRNVAVCDNSVRNCDNSGIAIYNSNDVDVINNSIQNVAISPAAKTLDVSKSIAVRESKNVRINNNAQKTTKYVKLAPRQWEPVAPAGGYNVQPFLVKFASPRAHQIQYQLSWNVQDTLPTGLTAFAQLCDSSEAVVATLNTGTATTPDTWSNGTRTLGNLVTLDLAKVADGKYTVRLGLSGSGYVKLLGTDDGTGRIIAGTLTLSGGGSGITFKSQSYDLTPFLDSFAQTSDSEGLSLAIKWCDFDSLPAAQTTTLTVTDGSGGTVATLNPGTFPDTSTWSYGNTIVGSNQNNTLSLAAGQYSLIAGGHNDTSARSNLGALTIGSGVAMPIWVDTSTCANVSQNANAGF